MGKRQHFGHQNPHRNRIATGLLEGIWENSLLRAFTVGDFESKYFIYHWQGRREEAKEGGVPNNLPTV